MSSLLNIVFVCGVCVLESWFKQPHLARVRLIAPGLGEAVHTCGTLA